MRDHGGRGHFGVRESHARDRVEPAPRVPRLGVRVAEKNEHTVDGPALAFPRVHVPIQLREVLLLEALPLLELEDHVLAPVENDEILAPSRVVSERQPAVDDRNGDLAPNREAARLQLRLERGLYDLLARAERELARDFGTRLEDRAHNARNREQTFLRLLRFRGHSAQNEKQTVPQKKPPKKFKLFFKKKGGGKGKFPDGASPLVQFFWGGEMVARRGLIRAERDALSYRFEHRCATCRLLLQPGWHADHIAPLADGGAHDVANLQPLCAPCHTMKTAHENSARSRRHAPRRARGRGTGDISDIDRSRAIVLTEKCTAAFDAWRARGEPFRVERYERIAGLCLDDIMRDKLAVTKTRTARGQAQYNISDLKHDIRSGFIVLG